MARELSDLHIHVGGAVAPHILWSIAHDQGFKLPVASYWEFKELISARPGKVRSLDEYLAVMHEWTEKIQSSPQAMERSVYEVIGKEYRSSRVSLIELRFNPMKRNVGGERDLDHIIHAALRGMDRAVLEYGVQAGLIFCLAREFPAHLNEILVEKAIKYRRRGVVGIDLAGTERHALELMPEEVGRYRELYARARRAGLKTTVHTGETATTGAEGVRAVVEQLEPHRIGHGICAARDEKVMDLLRERGVVLEICPSSNLATRAVGSIEELGQVLARFWDRGVRFTINTDGPYLLDTNMRAEVRLLRESGVLAEEQIDQALRWAREATFIGELP
ncbi:Adenosine deaminase [Anaeromyxobacter sp. K]|uniref:adenosine deaminase n=1 Tax=Anaeromyxobacter dehalogenans (strain ATCC BAA-258 / DSM 21875 / 2CP-1) TaxID=455488 RepID=B8JDJ7_ANAD2|nr:MULTISPECIES: adenosine deaminase [Anaeromyxobacter]ACG73840.1 Adenosine deaminase [Anaeromyxobacter sp. K]ACL66046.1 Adenosine deaminase [Anaeromyxobacter dehalogenans 2CP-1]